MDTSLVLAARERGFSVGIADEAVYACLARYRGRMREHRDADFLDVWYSSVGERELLTALGWGIGR